MRDWPWRLLIAVIVLVGLASCAAVAFVGFMAFREIGLGPWSSLAATMAAVVVLSAIGRAFGNRL